ncbi:hypothetical protein TBK1r_64530 [Stieleria magnilauensis]|uniref:Uncharacterized protein n=1 Tax=Stieleria magnilauensis TaxID=2527963 RepID=A0ABX5XZF6_9BACT|nr:hypothetical protein TBK1r_64530 [Planctomycetes bacterium TBK1r]
MGIQLSDKHAGPFKLEVEWIKARSEPAVSATMTVCRDVAYVIPDFESTRFRSIDARPPRNGASCLGSDSIN